MLHRGMAESVTVFRVSGRGGARQWFDGYLCALRQAGRRLEGKRMLPLPSMTVALYGRAWAREVYGYALQLSIEALEDAG